MQILQVEVLDKGVGGMIQIYGTEGQVLKAKGGMPIEGGKNRVR
jgi:hypothetical protein